MIREVRVITFLHYLYPIRELHSSSAALGHNSVFVSSCKDYVVKRVIHATGKHFLQHFVLQGVQEF